MSEDVTEPFRIAVVLGRADDMRAVVYVRLIEAPPATAGGRWHLRGSLSGPRCQHASTLPTTAHFRMLPAASAGVNVPTTEAILVEPGFWSPELPNRYQLELTITDEAGGCWQHSQLVGVRRLGHREGAFRLEGRRYVPRAVAPLAWAAAEGEGGLSAAAAGNCIRAAREASVAVWGRQPPQAVCAAADAEGVMLVAELPRHLKPAEASDEVQRLAVHPSVGFLVVGPEHLGSLGDWRWFRGTMQIGCRVDGRRSPPGVDAEPPLPALLDFVVLDLPPETLPAESWRASPSLPVLACQHAVCDDAVVEGQGQADGDQQSLRIQRRGCDALQAALASWLANGGQPAWEPAGYAVVPPA